MNEINLSNNDNRTSIMIFEIAWEQFAMELFEANEIIKGGQIRRLPRSLDYIEGIYNYRGEIIHIVDLKKKLKLDEYLLYKSKLSSIEKNNDYSNGSKNYIIIVNINNNNIGFLVDRIVNVAHVSDEDIVELSPIFRTSIGIEYIKAVVKFRDRPRVLLNISKLLSEVENLPIQKAISS